VTEARDAAVRAGTDAAVTSILEAVAVVSLKAMEARCQINEHHSETSRAQEEYNALQQRMATMGRWLRNICHRHESSPAKAQEVAHVTVGQRIFGRQDRRKNCFPKSCSKHFITKGLGYEAAWRQDRLRGSHNKTLVPLDIPVPPQFKISAVQCSTQNHHCVVAVACVASQQATLQNLQRTLQTLPYPPAYYRLNARLTRVVETPRKPKPHRGTPI
jgi:hypothetical protein